MTVASVFILKNNVSLIVTIKTEKEELMCKKDRRKIRVALKYT